ncbi:MAG: efflux RND transporter periplasmic adaptor subunit [Nitrospira sp.]|nr:efflux RND transporter periplasmic adaptor subunit [Nitrospira sp.]
MSESLFSTSWYRVSGLKPRLRTHARIHRHQYRGHTWYVLEDLAGGRSHRFSQAAYFVMGLMDGRRTVQEIWDAALDRLGDDAPTQDEMIRLLSQLYSADALQCDVPSDTAELFVRHQRQQRRLWAGRLLNPFGWKFPLFDPEHLLTRLLPVVKPLVSWGGLLLWALVVGAGMAAAVVHWTDLSRDVVDQLLAPRNLVALWLLFPVIKVLHEFGHAFMTKALGGEVHEMGVTLLVVTPVPYVDASSSSAFPDKWHRIAVGASGMMVELWVAALALFVWLNAEPGLVRTMAYNTIMIAGISTLLFNANPLLRFDGYYILADFLEIPNLRQRSTAYFGYLCERYAFGRADAEPPHATAGERAWFVLFGLASFTYRLLVMVGIFLLFAETHFVLGVVFAVLVGVPFFVVPLVRIVAYLATNPRLRRARVRAVTVSAAAAAALAALLFLAPVPWRTRAEGVVWLPDESYVRAGTEGFVAQVVAQPGAAVRRGDVLIVCEDSTLAARVTVLRHRLAELRARHAAELPRDLVKAQVVAEEMRYAEEDLALTEQRMRELVIRSKTHGIFVLPTASDLPGRFVKHGEVLGHVVDLSTVTVRLVVPQEDVDLIRHGSQGVELRLAERPGETIPASIGRLVPEATERLPSKALGSEGGGPFAVDPRDPEGLKTLARLFQVDLQVPARHQVVNAGGRALVRFDHGWLPLGSQWYRQVRQLFLSRLNV